MKICITAQGPTLDAPIDPRFGRCPNFIFVDPETLKFDAIPNPGAMAGGGAGIQAAQLVTDQGATAVLTGHVGPNAFNALSASGIKIFTGISGTVKTAIDQFQASKLAAAMTPTAPAHMGMGRGGGRGGGRGRGRGRGEP
jgi:predicted Fe-Mo cluster-binding NifX family protein